MYLIKSNSIKFFKEIRTNTYADYLGLDKAYISTILNGNKPCSEIAAKAFISTRCDISFTNENMENLLEKFFSKEK